jgi:hypothetical protein
MTKLIAAIIAGVFSVAVAGAYAATDTTKGEAKGDMAKTDKDDMKKKGSKDKDKDAKSAK